MLIILIAGVSYPVSSYIPSMPECFPRVLVSRIVYIHQAIKGFGGSGNLEYTCA